MVQGNLVHHSRHVRLRCELGAWRPHDLAPPAGFVVRHGSREELIAIRRAARRPLPAEFYTDLVDRVTWFYLGRVDGEPAHITWIYGADDAPPLITLGAGEVELRSVYTMAPYRARGLFGCALDVILADLRREGVRAAFAHVLEENTPSLRAFRSAGFETVGTVVVRKRLGARRLTWLPRSA